MSLKDKFNNFIDYFTEDGEEVEVREAKAAGAETQPVPYGYLFFSYHSHLSESRRFSFQPKPDFRHQKSRLF